MMNTGIFPFERFLKQYNVWEFHPMDQGGRLVHLQLIGPETDAAIVAAVRRPGFFAPWGDPIQWNRLETTELEKSVWLNRWYFIPSFARLYWLTGERSYLDDVLKLFRQWTKDNPLPVDLPRYFQTRQYTWRDMQVAWRTHNLIWCYFLGRDGFTEQERQEVMSSIQDHVRALMAYFGEQPLSAGNHQSHAAVAMLYAAVLFPELTDASTIQRTALTILNHHVEVAFFADGNSLELSPGYYPFIAANFRDAYLLCMANGIALSHRWKERLTRCHRFLREAQQPDGTTPPINDSSEAPVGPSLCILGDILGLRDSAQPTDSVCFAESNQAVMRGGAGTDASYVFLDAGQGWPHHWHAGKLGFHFWHSGRPYLVDTGVCSYDDPLRAQWYLRPQAHNTVLVDGLGDAEEAGRHSPADSQIGCRLTAWRSAPAYDLATMTCAVFEALPSPVTWMRQVLLLKGRFLVVMDHLESTDEHEYSWLFHFAPTTLRAQALQKRLLTGFDVRNMLLAPFQPESFAQMTVSQGCVACKGGNVSAPVARYTARAASLTTAFVLLPVNGAEFPIVQLRQTTQPAGVSLNIQTDRELIDLSLGRSSCEAVVSVSTVTAPPLEVAHA